MVSQNDINNTVQDNNFSVNLSTPGNGVTSATNHTDNTDSNSNAENLISSGGISGGDAFTRFNISSTQSYSLGIDNSDSDNLKITNGISPSSGTTFMNMDSIGRFNWPTQPAFSAFRSSDVNGITGDGTNHTIIFDSERFDIGGNFNTSTGAFTAPIAGIYFIKTALVLLNVFDAGFTIGNAVFDFTPGTPDLFWGMSPISVTQGNGGFALQGSNIVQMNGGDSVVVIVSVSGGGLTVNLGGGPLGGSTRFQGWLLG